MEHHLVDEGIGNSIYVSYEQARRFNEQMKHSMLSVRTSPNCSNCGMDGRKSSFSMREISERLMPVASARDCCVMESFFRLVVIRSARRVVDNFFMVWVLSIVELLKN